MRVLADFSMQSRWRAVGAVVALGAFGILFPPIAVLSAAVVALVALRLGSGQGLFVAGVGAVLLGALLMLLARTPPLLGIVAGLTQWLPVIAMAEVLRQTVSWRVTLALAASIAGAFVILVRFMVPDIEAAWVALGMEMLTPFLADEHLTAAELAPILGQIAPYLTGLLAGIFLLSMIFSLIIARYWQALLYNPGAFGAEFRQLALGRQLALALLVLAAVGHFANMPLGLELAFVLAVLFFLQGLAVMHGLTHEQNMSSFWLVGMYVLLVLALPHMFLFLAALGVVDSAAQFRERFARRPPDGPPDGS